MICVYILNCRQISLLWINKIPCKKKSVKMVGGARFHVLRTNEQRGKTRILMIRGACGGARAMARLKRPGLKRDVTCNKVLS